MEEIIKRPDGTRVKITVRIIDAGRDGFKYDVQAFISGPKKRKFFNVVDGDNFRYRRLSLPEREAYKNKAVLSVATAEEIDAILLKAWESIKPRPYLANF